MSTFTKIDASEFSTNPFESFGKGWALVSAEKEGKVNAMTISWGTMGIMWHKPSVTIVLRPQRYTRGYVNEAERFSLSFFEKNKFRQELGYLGKVSGKDEPDKVAKSGLVVEHFEEVPYFAEAKTVFILRKKYCQQMQPNSFYDEEISKEMYPERDYHYMYIAWIESILVRQ